MIRKNDFMKAFARKTVLFLSLITCHATLLAWGPEGHAMVGRLALRYVKADVRKNILGILGDMSIDTAANWMDIMKSNPDYDFMRTWHYIDFPKGQEYLPNNSENILNRLILTCGELKHKQTLCSEQIRTDLFILLHLMGDLHMPLHTGYEDDLGGNQRIVQYDTIKTHNLHTFWDVDIIKLAGIKDEDCVPYSSIEDSKSIDFTAWMKDSRTLLPQVYDFPDFTLDKDYLKKNTIVVEKQLIKAALRLALVLNELFPSPAPLADFKALTATYKNGIDVRDAANYIGKQVTVCSRVVGIRSGTTITQISLDQKYPNSTLTIIVKAENYSKFSAPIEQLFKDQNVCISGTVEDYKGKPQIIVEDPDQILILKFRDVNSK